MTQSTHPARTTFALYFGNRGFFPASLIAGARQEVVKAVEDAGHGYLLPPVEMTRYGAVETREEGRAYAEWLSANRGRYDGVILSMPNFSDENGAIAALQDCGVPILLQAYPDEIGKMDFEHRRDSYCGKFSIADVFHQYGLPFTMLEPHVVHPLTAAFRRNLDDLRRHLPGGQGHAAFLHRLHRRPHHRLQDRALRRDRPCRRPASPSRPSTSPTCSGASPAWPTNAARVTDKRDRLAGYTNCCKVPADKMLTLAKVGVAFDDYIDEYHLDTVAIRCWTEMQAELGIAPCVLLSEMNDRGVVSSCEIDICSAVTMRALNLASGKPAACLDWNNNYGDDPRQGDPVPLRPGRPIADDRQGRGHRPQDVRQEPTRLRLGQQRGPDRRLPDHACPTARPRTAS